MVDKTLTEVLIDVFEQLLQALGELSARVDLVGELDPVGSQWCGRRDGEVFGGTFA
jgi:hypothetical protein